MTFSTKETSSSPMAASTAAGSSLAPVARQHAVRRTVLAYHELSCGSSDYRYELSCGQFEQHLKLALQLQDQPGDREPPLVLSFDDGHISNYRYAVPLLETHSCKAVFFVITGRIGQARESMTWAQLKEIVELGHRVESHGWSHRFLTECSDHDLAEELARSRETLEQRLGVSVQALSAPHGRWSHRVLKACAQAGYHRLYTSDPWSSLPRPVEVIGRLVMTQSMDADRLLSWVTMGRMEAGLRRTQFLLKRSARQMMGNKLYYRLWTRLSGWNAADDTMLNGNQ